MGLSDGVEGFGSGFWAVRGEGEGEVASSVVEEGHFV